jgi:hypothetical protein
MCTHVKALFNRRARIFEKLFHVCELLQLAVMTPPFNMHARRGATGIAPVMTEQKKKSKVESFCRRTQQNITVHAV